MRRVWRLVWPSAAHPVRRMGRLAIIAVAWAVIWFVAASLLERRPLQQVTLVAGLFVALVISAIALNRIDSWRDARLFIAIYAGSVLAWCGLMALAIEWERVDYYWKFWLWGWFWIGFWWLILVNTPSWMVQVPPGEVHIRHRARDPREKFTFLEGSLPSMERNLEDCVGSLCQILQGYGASAQALQQLRARLLQMPDDEHSRKSIHDTTQQIQKVLNSPVNILTGLGLSSKNPEDSDRVQTQLALLLTGIGETSSDQMPSQKKASDATVRRTYKWVRPSDDVWLLWKQNDLVWVNATYESITTSDGLPFDLTVNFACTFNPSKVRAQDFKMGIPNLRPIEALKENISNLLNGAAEREARRFFARMTLQQATASGIGDFWDRLPALLNWADSLLGLAIQSWSIQIVSNVTDALRDAADRVRVADANAQADLARIRNLADLSEKIPPNLLLGLLFFDQPNKALRFPPHFNLSAPLNGKSTHYVEVLDRLGDSKEFQTFMTAVEQRFLASPSAPALQQPPVTQDAINAAIASSNQESASPRTEPAATKSSAAKTKPKLPTDLKPRLPGHILGGRPIEGRFRELPSEPSDDDDSSQGDTSSKSGGKKKR